MKGIIAVLLVGLAAIFVIRIVQKGNQPPKASIQTEGTMSKSDDLLLEELRYVSSKEGQVATEGFNIFYMYILIITIIVAAVSQLVADHLTTKASNTGLEITPLALDSLACVLLAAAFIFSCICFKAYFDTAKRQLDLLVDREKNKRKYDEHGYEPKGVAFEEISKAIRKKEAPQIVPSYIRYITILAASLCLSGCFAIGSAAIAFFITPYTLHIWDWHYYYPILAGVAVISVVSIACLMRRIMRMSPETNLLKYVLCLFLPFGICLVLSSFAPQAAFTPSNADCSQMPVTETVIQACNRAALPAFEIYVLAGFIGLSSLTFTYLLFMLYTYKRVEELSKQGAVS